MIRPPAIAAVSFLTGIVLGGCAAAPKPEETRIEGRPGKTKVGPADVVAGQSIYDSHCGGCHRLGKYDREGSGNLARHAGDVTPEVLAGHHGGDLSPREIADLRAFIAAR